MLMLTVFILAFSVEEFSWHLPRSILSIAYWQIFGELELLDEIESNGFFKVDCEHISFLFRKL